MPKQISMDNIVNAILDGYVAAQNEYAEMSGGDWLWQAPEYFITTRVAQEIQALDGAKYLTLEHGATHALKEAGAKGRGKLHSDIRENGRVDILLWWGSHTPRAVIEIKNQTSTNAEHIKDITRIKEFLRRNSQKSSLQFGTFSFYESASEENGGKSAADKVSDRIDRVYEAAQDLLGTDFEVRLHTSILNQELKDNAWQAACILIKLKKSANETDSTTT